MFNFIFVIIGGLIRWIKLLSKSHKVLKDPESSQLQKYNVCIDFAETVNKYGHVNVEAFGIENLPEEGGYIMYPNHQGKYDVCAIVKHHSKPCSFVMDIKKAGAPVVKEVVELVGAKKMEIDNPRQAITIIKEVTEEVKEGRPFILFPEGGYKFNNHNQMQDFKPGSFKIALKSRCPIVPVVLYDSYKVFNSFHIGRTNVEIHYLPPIPYETYQDMNTQELALYVQTIIQDKLKQIEESRA